MAENRAPRALGDRCREARLASFLELELIVRTCPTSSLCLPGKGSWGGRSWLVDRYPCRWTHDELLRELHDSPDFADRDSVATGLRNLAAQAGSTHLRRKRSDRA
jgi:hypothetical protein